MKNQERKVKQKRRHTAHKRKPLKKFEEKVMHGQHIRSIDR